MAGWLSADDGKNDEDDDRDDEDGDDCQQGNHCHDKQREDMGDEHASEPGPQPLTAPACVHLPIAAGVRSGTHRALTATEMGLAPAHPFTRPASDYIRTVSTTVCTTTHQ